MPPRTGADRNAGRCLEQSHELYNVGHMYEAAVAHFLATGKRTFLDIADQNADLCLTHFGPAPEQRPCPATRRSRSAWSSSTG